MSYTIRPAVPADLSRIEAIYAYAREFMRATGNPSQWGTAHPPLAQIENDIASKTLYVITENDTIHGVFYFAMENDPTYLEIFGGSWHSDAPYGVIHRIAGDGAGGMVRAAVAFAREKIPYLRMDTHADNHVMQHVLAKNGFQRCGIIYLTDGSPRIAFDLQ